MIEQQKIFKKWKIFDNLTSFCSILGLVVSIIQYESNLAQNISEKKFFIKKGDPLPDAYFDEKCNSQEFIIERYFVLVINLFGVVCVLIRRYLKLRWRNNLLNLGTIPGPLSIEYDSLVSN